jgi:hypothetical protein
MKEEEKIKDLEAVYSGAIQADKIELANMIKGGIDLIEKLQKEKEELKDKYATFVKMSSEVIANSIPVQKVKDKISERQFELQQEYKDFEDDAILTVLQELLKESEN